MESRREPRGQGGDPDLAMSPHWAQAQPAWIPQPARAALGQAWRLSRPVCGATAPAGTALALFVPARHTDQPATGEML